MRLREEERATRGSPSMSRHTETMMQKGLILLDTVWLSLVHSFNTEFHIPHSVLSKLTVGILSFLFPIPHSLWLIIRILFPNPIHGC